MDANSLLDEIEEMIARIETLDAALAEKRQAQKPEAMSSTAQRLSRARQSRLWWLKQVRNGMLAERPAQSLLH